MLGRETGCHPRSRIRVALSVLERRRRGLTCTHHPLPMVIGAPRPTRGTEYIPRGDKQGVPPYAEAWKLKRITSAPPLIGRTLAR